MKTSKKVIVITAGGTVESIDSVRSIRNSSSGKLGSLIAEEMKNTWDDTDIIYLSNDMAIRPDIEHQWIETTSVLDVEAKIEELLKKQKVDIFIHSMAVADYYVEGIETESGELIKTSSLLRNKLSSEDEQVKVVLKKAPKIISRIKEWQPLTFLVGFKLLNETTEENLFDVGFNLLRKNRCNLVLANDLDLIRKGNHEGLFIYPEKKYEKIKGKESIAQHLSKVLFNRAYCKHSRSIQLSEEVNVPNDILNQMKITGEELYVKGLLPNVEGGTYGNLSVRNEDDYFITGRNVHKGNLTADVICKIDSCEKMNEESVYAHVKYHGKVKPSIDSAIHHAIYEKLPESQAILHVHTDDIFNRPLSSYNYPCGTMEERDSIVEIMNAEEPIIQMKKHGVVIAGTTLKTCLKEWNDLQEDLRFTPFNLAKNVDLWEEWMTHVTIVGGIPNEDKSSMLNPENYYLIEEKGIGYGLCYVSVVEKENLLRFALFTSEEFQRAGTGIGKRSLQILEQIRKSEDLTLELLTKPACSVVDYYAKQGFYLYEEENEYIRMRKE